MNERHCEMMNNRHVGSSAAATGPARHNGAVPRQDKKERRMSYSSKFKAIVAFTFLFCAFMLQGWFCANEAQAAVAHDVSSESHTGTTGSTSAASFTWNHTPVGTPRGVVVFVYTISATDKITSVTYGGTTMTRVAGGAAVDSATEPGRVDTFFLGTSVPTGTQAVVVNRTNDTTIMYATATTVTAARDTEPTGVVLLQEDGTFTGQSVDDGTPGANSLRVAAGYSGGAAVLVGASTTTNANYQIDFGNYTATTGYETTAGQGARTVGFTYATSDDRAAVHLAVREAPLLTVGEGTNPINANAYRGSTNNALDGFTLAVNVGTASVTALTVTGSANFTATNIPTNGVKIYRDAGTLGTLDGADTLISSGSTAIATNATTVTLTAAEAVTTTAANYLVVVNINQGATAANTFTGTISAATGSGFGATTDSDALSATLTVTASTLTVGNGTNPANANVARSTTNNALNGFTLQLNGGTGTVTSLTVLGSANFTATNIPTNGVKIWRDLGTLGVLDGADVQISTASTAIATNATTVTISSETVTTTAGSYLVTVDLTATATIGNTFTANISAAAGTNLGTLTDSDAASATLTIVTPTLTIGGGTNPANANAGQGTTNNALNGFTLQMNTGSGTVTSLTVLGSANFTATNIPTNGVKVYRDAGTVGTLDGADTLISSGSTAIAGNATTVTLTAAETVTTTLANYLVVVDINAGATLANTFTGTISGAAGTGLGTPVDNDTTSATLTIICYDATPSTITIPAAQIINGSPYSLVGKYTTTGNVATLQHKVTYTPAAAPVTTTYYMGRDTTTNLTADGTCNVTGLTPYTSTGRGMTTTLTTDSAGASRYYPTVPAATATRALDVYTPVYAYSVNISNISVATALRGLATTDTVKIDLYAYNPAGAANNGTLVATGATKTLTSGGTTAGYTWATTDFTLSGSGTVPAGYRLQFRYTWTSATAGTPRVYFGVAGALTSTNFTVTETPTVTTCTDWTASTSIPTTTAGGSLCGNYIDGGTYTLDVKGTDPDCSTAITTTPTNFTWQSCIETATVTVTNPGVITAPTAITVAVGGTGGSNPQWSADGGATWNNSGAIYTPPTCATGNVTFTGRATGVCSAIAAAPVATTYDTTDKDLAILTVTGPASPVQGTKTVQVQVGTETAPDTLSAVVVNITGNAACAVSNGFMIWNGATSRWEYSWDSSGCGLIAPGESITITAQGTDPDCNNTVTSAPTAVTVDNSCIDTTSTVTWTVPGTTVTAPLVVTATGSLGVTGIEVSFDDGSTWQANGSTYTPKVDAQGTSIFRFRAFDTCGKRIYGGPSYTTTAPGAAYNVPFDGRLDRIRPLKVTATAAGKTSIKIEMTYCSDKNDNASTTVRYKLTSAPDLPANWTTVGPYVDGADADGLRNQIVLFMLTGLTTDTSYDIELTIAETAPDVVDWSTIQITQATAPPWKATVALTSWLDSNLLHNALRFACSKIGYANQTDCVAAGGTWNLDRKWTGGWGLPNATYPNAQYESFECSTCHVKNSSNVKRVITTITPKADAGTQFPATVNLLDVREGTAEFGDDSDNHTTSNRVCEVCHSQTTYHRKDTTGLVNKLHNNKTDCIRCHEHNVGFRASCDSCHGTPPVSLAGLATQPATTGSTIWGEHQKHAVDLGYECKTCHNGWDNTGQMPNNGNLNIGFKPSLNPQFNGAVKQILGGTYEGRTTGGGYTGDTSTTPATVVNTGTGAMTCAVYCHGYARPVWNPTSSQPCGSCHGGINTGVGYRSGAPTGLTVGGVTSKDLAGLTSGLQVGKHANHLDDSVYQTGDPCALCHDGFSYTDATHVNGTVNVKLRQAAKLSSPGTTGGAGLGSTYNADRTCTTECHGPTNWDSASILNCTQSCHNYPPVGITAGYSTYANVNIKPVNHTTPNGVQYLKDNHGQCLYCHGWNDNGSGALPITGMTAAQLTAMNGDPAEAPNFSTYSNPDNLNGQHMDGTITLNDDGDGITANDADYDPLTGGCDNAVCHGNDASHRFTIPGGINSPLKAADIGPGDCGACHTTGVGGATIVTSASSHTRATLGGAFTGCTACHSGHYIKVGGVKIPNNATVGINYAGTQHGGINLGGPGTHASIAAKTTEAEICWGCHDALGTANVKKNTITFTATTIVDSGAGLGVFTVGKPLKVMGSSVVANNKWVTPTAVAAGTLTFPAATFTADATAGEMITLQDFVSEWGGNTPQTGTPVQAQYQYNYGSLSTSNWTTATWTSGKADFAYKTAKIQSTHAANSIEAGATSTVTGSAYAYKETVDNVALIRCSYCHDVHNAVGPNGPPYLRGTWWGNPYEEDGAPQASKIYFNTAPFGAVPRGNGANQGSLGGFFIDINNVRPGSAPSPAGLATAANGTASINPTATGGTGTGGAWTLADSAGLCITCHGNNPSTMNWNTTETNLWFSTNGHANAVIGGTGTGGANVFNLRGGTASTTGATVSPAMHYWGGSATASVAPGDVGAYGFRNGANSQYNYTPSLSTVSENNEITTPGTNRWGTITIDGTTVNSLYHKFSCSKCHNPHASRLPKLMITNCLDTKHNTWDDSYQLNASTGINTNRSISNWSTAQNCHRVGGIIPATRVIPGDPTTGGPTGNGLYAEPVDASAVGAAQGTGTDYSNRGWNTVTPW